MGVCIVCCEIILAEAEPRRPPPRAKRSGSLPDAPRCTGGQSRIKSIGESIGYAKARRAPARDVTAETLRRKDLPLVRLRSNLSTIGVVDMPIAGAISSASARVQGGNRAWRTSTFLSSPTVLISPRPLHPRETGSVSLSLTDDTFTVSEFIYLLMTSQTPTISVDTAHRRQDRNPNTVSA
jgi:hypothetical protein